jgi:Fe-S-cluster containining protein
MKIVLINSRRGNKLEEKYKYLDEKIVVTHKCSGDCCRMFYLQGMNYEEVKEYIKHFKDSKEANTIIDMIIPLSTEEANEVIIKTGLDKIIEGEKYKIAAEKGHLFTCKHFDGVENKCLIYKDRPAMCKNYPHYDNKPCIFPNCGMKYISSKSGTDKNKKEE